MHTDILPIAPHAALPDRKAIRQWLLPLSRRSTAYPLFMLALDLALFAASIAATLVVPSLWGKLASGLCAGVVIARLFIIGHDACHQSLTPHRRLNRWLGRIAFLPSLTPYSLWDMGHNVVHHGYTNLKGFDFVWAPLTAQEFAALSPTRQRLERVYRSGFCPGLYYLVDIWWKRMYFPNAAEVPTRRRVFIADNLLVTAFALVWVGALVASAMAAGESVPAVMLAGFILPLTVWFTLVGFVVYAHHTHTSIAWHSERILWSKAQPFVSTTVHLTFPARLGGVLHNIMEHTAHHVDMSIPFYRLCGAQERLERLLPQRIVIQRFSWRWYFETARRCKLYDFKRGCWTDFAGSITSPGEIPAPVAAS
jgi:omega-6 fatty acid desaturase (delta-12 desaturase)